MNNLKKNAVSIIIPVLNEKESLEICLKFLKVFINQTHEILIVYDHKNDNCLEVKKKLLKKNIKFILNDLGPGISNAIRIGIKKAKYKIIMIMVTDEIIPLLSFEKMLKLIVNDGYDIVSATRYSLGGNRFGGSFIGKIFSYFGNLTFCFFTNFPIRDLTTGIKMFKKDKFLSINKFRFNKGWVFAFELVINFYLKNFRLAEVPIISIDRVHGGKSSFNFFVWFKEYFKCYIWGIKKIKFL